jgi:sucrose-6-phosphate hydrolase SacC (GH32 family)
MALYLDGSQYAIFNSTDLSHWTQTSTVEIPGSSECPDLFELPTKGGHKWVFWSASGAYRLGDFDGKTFTPTTDPIRTNFGNTSYAAQTFYQESHGRRVQVAWLNNANFPQSTSWNQQMGVPTRLELRDAQDGPRLTIYPVSEVEKLRKKEGAARLDQGNTFAKDSGLYDVETKVSGSGKFTVHVNNVEIVVDTAGGTLSALGKTAKIPAGGDHTLRVLADKATVEIFLDGGLVYMPLFALPEPGKNGVSWNSEGASVKSFQAWEMSSAW